MAPSILTQVKEPPQVSELLPSTEHMLSEERLHVDSLAAGCRPGEKYVGPTPSEDADLTDLYLLTFTLRGGCFIISLKK